jgi:hypothetical protein
MARQRFLARPYLFSGVLFATVFYLDSKYEGRRLWHWFGLPLIMCLWANTHAGVLYGFVLIGALAGSDFLVWLCKSLCARRASSADRAPPGPAETDSMVIRLSGVPLAFLAAAVSLELINPNGCRVMFVPVTHFFSPFWQAGTHEYFPPSFRKHYFFWTGLLVTFLLQVITLKRLNVRLLLVNLAFAVLAIRSQRSILFYALVFAPYVTYLLNALPVTRLLSVRAVGAASGVLVICCSLVLGFLIIPDRTYRYGTGLYRDYYPVEVFDFIRKQVPAQNLFHDMRYGGSVLWWLYPDFRPFVDGRGTAYSVEFWQRDYLPVISGSDRWRDVFDTYDVNAVLLWNEPAHDVGRLARALFEHPDWALVAYNDTATLFLKRTSTNQETILANEHRYVWPGDWGFSGITKEVALVALREVDRTIRRSSDSVHARTAAARICMTIGEYATAALWYEGLVGDGAGGAYWRDYGYSLYVSGDLEKADVVFGHMAKNGMGKGFPFYMRHFIAARSGAFEDAADFLKKALELEPENDEYMDALKRLERVGPKKDAYWIPLKDVLLAPTHRVGLQF